MACFGAKPDVIAELWTRINPEKNMPKGHKPKHILWMLIFLKLYDQEEINSVKVGGVDEKTFRKWTWLFIEATSYLEYPVVSQCFMA